MKSIIRYAAAALIAAILLPVTAAAQSKDKNQAQYHNAAQFPLYGKATEFTAARYQRLPADYQQISRESLWHLGCNSAGLFIRFKSNSPYIRAHWKSSFGGRMNHMTPTGQSGLDLYILHKGTWMFAGSARPANTSDNDVAIVQNMDRKEREYMLYLSLYDGVDDLEIGIDPKCWITGPEAETPSREKPIVMYGTSILQGGCANRPGMAHPSILSRRLDREVINLGFSGNAHLDMEIARLMADVADPGLFILDYVPNAQAPLINEKGEEFFRIIRSRHPDVPVIFVEAPNYPHMLFDEKEAKGTAERNKAQRALYQKLKKMGEKNIYYVDSKGMLGTDNEATVDGVHFTDLGAMRYVDHIYPTVIKALKAKPAKKAGSSPRKK